MVRLNLPMLTILHGDHIVESRKELSQLKETYKDAEVIELGGNVDLPMVKQALESQSLFALKRLVIFENLFASKGDGAKEILSYLGGGAYDAEVVMWEGKTIDGRRLTPLKKAQVKVFALDKHLFQFLESLRPNNPTRTLSLFHTLLERESVELLFFMVVRQVRLLLGARAHAPIPELSRMAPWQRDKLISQASTFRDEASIVALLEQLFWIEYKQKSGQSGMSLTAQLDIFLSSL